MMKNITKRTKKVLPVKLVLSMLALVLLSQVAFSQDSRVETFDEEVLITPIYKNSITGVEIDDNIIYDYVKDIEPGTGRWFTGTSGGEANFKWVADAGQDGGGAIALNYTGSGAVTLFYILNNKNQDYSIGYDFSARFLYGLDPGVSDRLGAVSHLSIPEPDPADNSSVYWRTYNAGTGAFSDNGIVRFKGGNNTGRIFWNPDFTGSGNTTDWNTYGGDGTLTTDMTGDWIVFGFAFGKSTAVDNASEFVRIDEITLPFKEGIADKVSPTITVQEIDADNFGVFPSEVGKMYLVPAGTENTASAIMAASLNNAMLAVPLSGSLYPKAGLANGKYDIYVIDGAGNVSNGAQVNIGADTYAPLITANPSGTSIYAGFDNISVIVDEASTLKLVADGAGAGGTEVISTSAAEKTLTNLIVPETVAAGAYDLYAIDGAGNASIALDITIEEPDVVAPVVTITSSLKISTADTISYVTDEPAVAIYIAPLGTENTLVAVQAAALDSIVVTSESGMIPAINLIENDYSIYAMDRFGNIAPSAESIYVGDILGPVAFQVTAGVIDKGFPIVATLNENGILYIVEEGTSVENVKTSAIATDSAFANVPAFVLTNTSGFVKGNSYDVYALDLRDNWSDKLSTVMIAAEEEEEIVLSSEPKKQLIVYPNPVASTLFIQADDFLKATLYDFSGRVTVSSVSRSIDISQLKNGIYMVRIVTSEGVEVRKISVSH